MKVEHITYKGSTLVRDTDDITEETINLLKPFEDINKEKSKLKFPLTNLEVVTTIASNVAIFNFEKNNIPLYMNFCCFEAKDAVSGIRKYSKNGNVSAVKMATIVQ